MAVSVLTAAGSVWLAAGAAFFEFEPPINSIIYFGVGVGRALMRSTACHVDGSNLRLSHGSSRTLAAAGTISAISSIKLLMTAGGFHYGSEFRLYRRG